MQAMLEVAAVLLVATGVAHSWLGERYILMRLFRHGDLPQLFGGTEFTARTLRFAWHITSLAWFGFAALLLVIARGAARIDTIGAVAGSTFIAHGVLALAGSRGRHLSWVVFFLVGSLILFATRR